MENRRQKLKKYILLIFIIFCALYCFVLNFSKHQPNNIFLPKNNIVSINFEAQDASCFKVKNKDKFYDIKNKSAIIKDEINNLEIFVPSGFKGLKNVAIYNGENIEYFGNLSDKKAQNENGYNKYIFKIENKNSLINALAGFFVSFFSGNKIFIPFYILIFIALIISKNSFFKGKYQIFLILLLASVIRINITTLYPVGDENYTLTIIHKTKTYAQLFSDPGNPFLYYFIVKILNNVFHFNFLALKYFMAFVSIFGVFALYFVLKKSFNLKTANIGAFLASINCVLLYFSQELRCYGLTIALSPILVYLFFKLLATKKIKYYYLYILLSIIAVNLHFYEHLFVAANFIFGIYYFILKKQKQEIKKFIFYHFLIFLSALPSLILSTFNGLLFKFFNDWIPKLSFDLIKGAICFVFGSVSSFIIALFFIFKSVSSEKLNRAKIFSVYIFWVFAFIFLGAILFSYFLKPIFYTKYFALLVPLFLMFAAIIMSQKKTKTVVLIYFIWFFMIQNRNVLNNIFHKKLQANINNCLYIMRKQSETIAKPIYFLTSTGAKFTLLTPDFKEIKKLRYSFINTSRKTTPQKEIEKIKEMNDHALIFTFLIEPKDSLKYSTTCYYSDYYKSYNCKIEF